ncbi:MAG: hypothetical protein WAK93_11010 [Solirubrobacteraceae bacterium]
MAFFAVGYVMGTKAGTERYAQIVQGMATTSQRLEEFSARRSAGTGQPAADSADRRS